MRLHTLLRVLMVGTVPSCILVACDESQESEREMLESDKQRIVSYAQSGGCAGSAQCLYRGLGSKPCGGSWEYIVYSTTLDTAMLHRMIEEYNSRESAFNQKWGVVSDCSIPPPPDSVRCEDGTCVGYWNGIPLRPGH
jgi:hypothetical protein